MEPFDIHLSLMLCVCSLCCIAPTLAAKVLPNVTVTVGCDDEDGGRWPYAGTAGAIVKMGANHINADVTISF